jgi:tellurite resistance protein TehA-like permease
MTRQTILGILFLVFGLVVAAVMLAPLAISAFHGQAAPITMTAVVVLCVGVGLAIYGAFLLPSSGAKSAFHDLSVELSESSLPVVGGHKVTATATLSEIEIPPKAEL